MIRTFLFLVALYLLVKFISRMFLSGNKNNKKQSTANFIYKNFSQFSGQQQQQKQTEDSTSNFEEIEEAEYEDITEEEDSSSKTSG